jgi:hypothetical protein
MKFLPINYDKPVVFNNVGNGAIIGSCQGEALSASTNYDDSLHMLLPVAVDLRAIIKSRGPYRRKSGQISVSFLCKIVSKYPPYKAEFAFS